MVPVTFHGGPLDGVTVEAGDLPTGSRYRLDGQTYVHEAAAAAGVGEDQLQVRPGDVGDDVQLRPASDPDVQVRPAPPRGRRGSGPR